MDNWYDRHNIFEKLDVKTRNKFVLFIMFMLYYYTIIILFRKRTI